MLESTKEKSAQMKDEMVHRAAQSAAEGAEKLAVGSQKTADSVRAWADGLDRVKRPRAQYVGLGIVAALIALVVYLMTSKGEHHREQLQELGSDMVDKVAS